MLRADLSVKTIAALLMIILFSAVQLQAATPRGNRSAWRVLSPPGAGFTILMPGQPVIEINGASIQYSFVERRLSGNYFYGISHEDFVSVPADTERLLRGKCSNYARGLRAEVVKWTTVTRNALKGVAARVESKNNSSIVVAWLVNRRAYYVAFATSKTQVLPDEARQFIDSLTLARF